jgi:N-acetylmuramic acid 6-phosphate etherase
MDVVIGLAASGTTPFVWGALREAKSRHALTGCVVNVIDVPLIELVQHAIAVPTGPEVIMGSTRLKAGTAQKMILNMISTGVMVRVGRTYSNLMTDMQVSNAKLRGRAVTIVAEATGLSLETATTLLTQAAGEMKTAIAAAKLGIPPHEARQRLAESNGNLNRVLGETADLTGR